MVKDEDQQRSGCNDFRFFLFIFQNKSAAIIAEISFYNDIIFVKSFTRRVCLKIGRQGESEEKRLNSS